MNGNRAQQYHTAQSFVDYYLFGPGTQHSRPTAQERIAAARRRIKKGTTPEDVLHKQQMVINVRTELAEIHRRLLLDEHDGPAVVELQLSYQRHQHWLAHELKLRKVLSPSQARTNLQPYTHPSLTERYEMLQVEDSDEEGNEETQARTVEMTTVAHDSLSKSTDAAGNDDTLQLLSVDISDMIDLILELQKDMIKGSLNIAAGQLVCETAWKRIEAYEAEMQLVGGGGITNQILHKLRVRRLKDLPYAMSLVKELIGGDLRSRDALRIDAVLRLIPEHRTVVPPVFTSIYIKLKDFYSSKPPKPTRLILYVGILLVRDIANLWTAQSCSDLRTSLQQTRNQIRGLVGRFLDIVPKPGTSNIPSQGLGTHKLMGLLEGWSWIPTDLHPLWYSFWIMTILTPLTSLCRLGAAEPIVVESLHMYFAVRGDVRNPTLDSFCEAESPSFPAGIPYNAEELEASYSNNVAKPVAKTLAMRRIKRPHQTADELMSRQCHIGNELMQILRPITRENTKLDDITDCDILDALKKKLVDDLDNFPNTIDLSYTMREVMKDQQQIASIESLRQFTYAFNIQWTGFSRSIRSPKLGESMVFSWEEFLKTEKPTYDSLFAIIASVSQGILRSVRSARNIASAAAFPPQTNGTKSLWRMLLVKANGSIDNLPSYLEELELVTQNSPYLAAAAIQDFLAAIYSWIPPTQCQSYDFRNILCDRPGELLNQMDNDVELVEKMVAEVEKARIDTSQYVQSQHRTPKASAESAYPAKSLAAASIEFLKQCVADGSVDSKHASIIDDTTKLIGKCFGVGGREPDGRSTLLDIFTNYEKQRAETLNIQGNSFMKSTNFPAAIRCYTEALQLDPENPKFLCNRSIAYSKVNDKTRANVDAKAAVQANPSDARAQSHLGYTEFWLGNPRGSLEAYQQAVELYRSSRYCDTDKARRKANDGLTKAEKGLEKAKDWLVNVEGANAVRDAESVPESKSTSIRSGGSYVAIELPVGFRWGKQSSCGQRLVKEIPREGAAIVQITCDTRSSPLKYFYTDYTMSKDVLHYFLTWLSFTRPQFHPPVKSLKFDTSQNISNAAHRKAARVVEEVLANSIISKDCSVFVNSTPHKTITIPSEPSYLFGLSRKFRKTGVQLSKEEDYEGALESFYSAVAALEDINPPLGSLIIELVESRSYVLEMHIKAANYEIAEDFVNNTYTLARVPQLQGLKLNDFETKKLQGCMVQCAVLNKEWDNLSRAKEFATEATKIYGRYIPAEALLSDIEKMVQSRKQGHFPRLKSLEYGKMTKESEDPCPLCQKHLVVDDGFDLVKSCSHLFHHHCLSKCLSEQFHDAPTQLMLATALGGKITLELRCPTCSEKINHCSMQQGHVFEWMEQLQSN